MEDWNRSCVPPWEQFDLERKISQAEKAPDIEARGFKLQPKKSSFGAFADAVAASTAPSDTGQIEEPRAHSGILDDPASIAIRFFEQNKIENNLCQFRWWNGQYYQWNGSFYNPMAKEEIDSIVFWFVEDTYIKKYLEDCANCPADPEKLEKIKKKKVNKTIIENVKIAINSIISINEKILSEPFWLLSPPYGWSADEIIPTFNRLIHLPSFVQNNQTSFVKKVLVTFSTYSLKYNFNFNTYDGPVSPPPVWGDFLSSVWPDDPHSIDCLQEWYGYLITHCTKLQKMLMLIGQRRSGKGTIMRTLKHMLGSENVLFPTFKSLTTEFGKQALIGKTLAIFPDARLTSRTDVGDVVELLLSITGEDDQTINRKYLTHTTKRLTSRFIISSNELPRLTENSGALVSRAIILKFDESFLDKENINLEDDLMPEIPAILRWSIDGWKRLFERGRFSQPETGAEIIRDFLHLSSPVSHFISDCLDQNPTFSSDIVELFSQWKGWCQFQGRDTIGDMDNFTRNLRAAIPSIQFGKEPLVHNGDGVAWSRLVTGVRVRSVDYVRGDVTADDLKGDFTTGF